MPNAQLVDWMWTIGGPFVAVCVALWLFYTNRIYTKKAYDDMLATKEKEIIDVEKRAEELWTIVKTNLIIAEKALDKAASEREARR